MKINKLLIAIGAFGVTLLAGLTVTSGNAFAATKTWDGGGSDDNFSTGANWDGDTAPTNGDSLVLPRDVIFSGCTDMSTVTLNNDFDPSTVTLAGIATSGNSPSGCGATLVISGNGIKSSGEVAGNAQESYWPVLDLQVPLTATEAIEISSINSTSSLSIGANNITVKGVEFDGGVSGSGDITIGGFSSGGFGSGDCTATVDPRPFAGDSSGFSGNIIVTTDGYLGVSSQQNDIARHATSISSGSSLGFGLDNGQNMEFTKSFTLSGGDFSASQSGNDDCEEPTINKKVTITEDVTLTAETDFYLYRADVFFAGAVTGKQNIKLADGQTGSITFADGSTLESAVKKYEIDTVEGCNYLGYANSANTNVIVNVDCTQSEFYKYDSPESPIEVRGIISGTGRIGHVKILNGGVIAPGLSPGTLTTSNITWLEGGIYEFEIGKDGADQIVANGTVTLGNGTLKVLRFEDYAPKAGDAYTIIANDGSDAVSGTFKDLPEGATFTTEDGAVYRINYGGGDGNDVTLTVVTAPQVPNTGFGMLTNNPLLTLVITTVSAGMIAVIARKQALQKS